MIYDIDEQRTVIKDTMILMIHDTKELFGELIEVIKNNDIELSKKVVEADKEINALDTKINDLIVEYIVAQAPLAGDLREVVSYLKIASDVERIADYTTNIAKYIRGGLTFNERNIGKITYGCEVLIELLSDIMALINQPDITLCYEVAKKDDILDELYRNYYVTAFIKNLNTDFEETIATINILKQLERAGDHIVNVIENLIYALKGKRVDL